MDSPAQPTGEAAPTPGRGARAARVVRHLALLLLSFGLVSAWVRSHAPWPSEYAMDAKMEAFFADKDEFDCLYVGPSSIYRSFMPEVIDPIVSRELGRPFRSFNLGMGALFGHETDAILREVLASKPARLKWVVMQPGDYYPQFRLGRNIWTEREVRWHDLQGTLEVLRSVAIMKDQEDWELPAWERFKLAFTHIELLGWHYGNFGLGKRMLAPLFGADDPELPALIEQMRRQGGYQALEDARDEEAIERGKWFRENPQDYIDKVADLRSKFDNVAPLEDYNFQAHLDQQAMILDGGYELFYVVPPIINPPALINALRRKGLLPQTIDLNGPDRYPVLYRPELHFDRGHLNRAGAQVFSEMFAERLIDAIEKTGAP